MKLSSAAQIGQCVMVGFDGLVPDAHIKRLIREYRVGGVILFRRNVADPRQVAALCRALQEINAEVSDVPLLIGIDQEGGMVARIEEGLTPLPSALAYQAAGSVADCEALWRHGAAELAALGINVDFAPVLDVNNNPANPVIGVRAFGEDTATVCDYGLAALRGIQAAGMAGTAKHFPGHGDTDTDSHLGVPRVGHGRARLDAVELAPFRAAIAAGVDGVMSSHVAFPAVEPDPDTPSTLSRAVLTGLLRDELGFDGVVFTDCLEMDAIARGVGTEQGALAAFQAGADVVLVSHRADRQIGALELLAQALAQGTVSAAQLAQSCARVLALKARRGMAGWRQLPADPTPVLRTPDALALSGRVHRRALTRQGPARALDPALPVLLLAFEVQTRTEIDEVALGNRAQLRDSLALPLQARGFTVEEMVLGLQPDETQRDAVQARAAQAPQIVVLSYNAVLHPAQRDVLAALPPERVWLVAGRLPYDLALLPQAAARLTLYANRPAALSVLAAALAGEHD
ncbi:beta-N-acetylhexosaminidase [Chitiniphilus purpureus]|uniref:Beta-N-acetylhexosaminidase n=1 Tax=Chitiniphilus purpureus TaxID=2981137 RepID=A0ABY6DS86_9NEIS|nr:beta-N-acetylhexosaminidase [Chitiniphilus sp. CD1]UXY17225.1 beta-N-acetylhexosaminidase [Chitiniphilus sp. CD1]